VKRAWAAVTKKNGRESRSGMCVEHDALRDWRLEAVVQRYGANTTYDERGGFEARTGHSSQCTKPKEIRKQGNGGPALQTHDVYSCAK